MIEIFRPTCVWPQIGSMPWKVSLGPEDLHFFLCKVGGLAEHFRHERAGKRGRVRAEGTQDEDGRRWRVPSPLIFSSFYHRN